jgi:hypothetical protein
MPSNQVSGTHPEPIPKGEIKVTKHFASYRTLAALALVIALAMTSCTPATQQPQPTPTMQAQPLDPTATSTKPAPTAEPCISGYENIKIVHEFGPGTRFTDWAVADFSGDGMADILVARGKFITADDYPAYFFSNDGQGSFSNTTDTTFEVSVPRSQTPREIVMADFNGDNLMDIFIIDAGSDTEPWPGYQNALILTAPGGKLVDATANLPQQSDFSHSATTADIDDDGDIDIFVGNVYGGNRIPSHMLINDGQAQFSIGDGLLPAAQIDMDQNKYTSSLFVDINNDGFPDLILGADTITKTSAALLNDGSGYFSLLPDALPSKPHAENDVAVDIASGDLNGDGLLDLAISWTKYNYLGRYLQVLINQGDMTFSDETQTRIPSQGDFGETYLWFKFIELTDADQDGDLDLLTHVLEESVIYENDGSGVFEPSTSLLPNPSSGWYWYTLADVDGDGHRDFIADVPPANTDFSAAFAVGLWSPCP